MAKITYSNKVTLNPQPSIADINKVTSDDMNEIKSVVNANDDTATAQGTAITNLQTYSTTEVNTDKKWIDNKPIYRKVIDFGALPNATAKEVNHNISNIDKIVHQEAIAMESSGTTYCIPHVGAPNMGSDMTMSMRSTHTWVQIYCSSNMSSYSGYFILEYTKTTDNV